MRGPTIKPKVQLLSVIISLFLIVSLGASTVTAHPPSSIELSYDPAEGVLEVTISHRVGNTSSHYVEKVVVTRNGETVMEKNYSEQEGRSEFTYRYSVAAQNGDTLSVNAKCNRFGDQTESLTVEGLPVETSELFHAKLSPEAGGLDLDDGIAAEASGVAVVLLDPSSNSLEFLLSFKGLSGVPTGAGLWRGSEEVPESRVLNVFGQNGQSLVESPDGSSAFISGVWDESSSQPLTGELVEEFLNGRIYVNVRTEMNPEGEIRARLVKVES